MPYCQCVSKCTTEDYPCQVNQCLGIMSFQILKVILSNLRFSLLRRIATFQQRADQTQDQIKTRSENGSENGSERLTMKLGLIMDHHWTLLRNGKMDVSTWIPFCIFSEMPNSCYPNRYQQARNLERCALKAVKLQHGKLKTLHT